ncbi:hypothetical protein L204_103222 [Cryptococcus depauperatus]
MSNSLYGRHAGHDMSGMDNMPSSSNNMGMGMKMYFHGSIGGDMGVCIGLFLFAVFERYLVAFRRACDSSWRRGLIGYARPTSAGRLEQSDGQSTSLSAPTSLSRRPSIQKAYNSVSQFNLPVDKDADMEDVAPYTTSTARGYLTSSYNPAEGSQPTTENEAQTEKQKEKAVERGELHTHLPRAVRRTLDPGRQGRWSRPFRWTVDVPRGLLQALQVAVHYLLMLVVMTFNIWWTISVIIGSGVGEMLFGRFGSSPVGH